MSLSQHNLLSISDLNTSDIELVLETAKKIGPSKILAGKIILQAFFEPSTRTRLSFETAALRLGAGVIQFDSAASSVTKGETTVDTFRTVAAMKPDLLVIRSREAGLPQLASEHLGCPVINAGDGMHEHPTQALLDLKTILDKKGRIKNLKIGLVGDIAHSRVARSNMLLLRKMGAKVTVVGPATLIPKGIEQYQVTVSHNFDKVLPELDVVMMLRLQNERQTAGKIPSLAEYSKFFGLTAARLKKGKSDLMVMHPGPVNRGVEIAPEVADGVQSVILDQVAGGVKVRMALLKLLLEH